MLESGDSICLIGVDPDSQAGDSIRELVEGQTVKLHFDQRRAVSRGDKPAYVYLADGRLVNAELIKRGYARVDRTSAFQCGNEFIQHQLTAQKKKRVSGQNEQVVVKL